MGQFGMDEENEAEKKVETVEELKKRRKAFAYWTVGGEDYKLKLTTQQICKLEEKFRCNLVTLIMQSGGLPQLGIMLTVIQAAMTPWKHGVKYKDVQALYDQYADGRMNSGDIPWVKSATLWAHMRGWSRGGLRNRLPPASNYLTL